MFYSQFLLNNYFIPSSTHWNFIQNMVQLTCWPHPLFQISFMINQWEVYKWWTFVLSPLINCLTLNHVQFSNELLFSLLLIVMYNTLMFEVSPSGINYKSSWQSSITIFWDCCNFVLPIVRLHGFVFFSYFLGMYQLLDCALLIDIIYSFKKVADSYREYQSRGFTIPPDWTSYSWGIQLH